MSKDRRSGKHKRDKRKAERSPPAPPVATTEDDLTWFRRFLPRFLTVAQATVAIIVGIKIPDPTVFEWLVGGACLVGVIASGENLRRAHRAIHDGNPEDEARRELIASRTEALAIYALMGGLLLASVAAEARPLTIVASVVLVLSRLHAFRPIECTEAFLVSEAAQGRVTPLRNLMDGVVRGLRLHANVSATSSRLFHRRDSTSVTLASALGLFAAFGLAAGTAVAEGRAIAKESAAPAAEFATPCDAEHGKERFHVGPITDELAEAAASSWFRIGFKVAGCLSTPMVKDGQVWVGTMTGGDEGSVVVAFPDGTAAYLKPQADLLLRDRARDGRITSIESAFRNYWGDMQLFHTPDGACGSLVRSFDEARTELPPSVTAVALKLMAEGDRGVHVIKVSHPTEHRDVYELEVIHSLAPPGATEFTRVSVEYYPDDNFARFQGGRIDDATPCDRPLVARAKAAAHDSLHED